MFGVKDLKWPPKVEVGNSLHFLFSIALSFRSAQKLILIKPRVDAVIANFGNFSHSSAKKSAI
jgi:hypothetical protein